MAVDHALLRTHWQLMKQATANDLFAGLAEIARTVQNHLHQTNANDPAAAVFMDGYRQVVPANENSETGIEPAGISFHPEKTSPGEVENGKRLFRVFAGKFKPGICSQQGVMGLLLKGTVNTVEMPLLLATHIINHHLADQEEWYSFSLLIASLIDREGIENFCR